MALREVIGESYRGHWFVGNGDIGPRCKCGEEPVANFDGHRLDKVAAAVVAFLSERSPSDAEQIEREAKAAYDAAIEEMDFFGFASQRDAFLDGYETGVAARDTAWRDAQ